MNLLCSIFGHRLEYGELRCSEDSWSFHYDGKRLKGHRCTRCPFWSLDHKDYEERREALIKRNWEARRKEDEANLARLDGCAEHAFDKPRDGRSRVCRRCRGELPIEAALWYERGVRDARAQPGVDGHRVEVIDVGDGIARLRVNGLGVCSFPSAIERDLPPQQTPVEYANEAARVLRKALGEGGASC